ncbi:MAG: hypothetical protein JJLCMIEE_02313 [Acidimicrobiales bacterium]|nr:hypothetical protein [Acidimicrobiales bacterium]
MRPTVSIGLPVRDGARYIDATLKTLRAQTLTDFEIVISDNASTDGTRDICLGHAGEDDRIRYFRQVANLGAAANFNRVFALARAPLFKWAAHDDRYLPGYLESLVAELERSASCVLSFPRTVLIDASGTEIEEYDDGGAVLETPAHRRVAHVLRTTRPGRMANPVLGVIRSSALGKTAGLGAYPAADKVLLVELAMLGGFAFVDDPLFRRRVHEASSVRAARDAMELAEWFDPAASELPGGPRSLLFANYLRAVLGVPCSLPERARSLYTILWAWFFRYRNWRVIAGEQRRRLQARARRPWRR